MRAIQTHVAVFVIVITSAVFSQTVGGKSQSASGTGGRSSAASTSTLPKDVYSDSRNRLPLIKRENLDERGKKVYDESVADPRSLAGLQGPAGIHLYSPRLAESVRVGNQYLRFQTDLGRRLSELAILITARELDQQFEWTAHEPAALAAGLEQGIIDVVKYRRQVAALGEKEAVVVQLGREIFGRRRVSPDTFARGLKLFGEKGIVDLVSLMGEYSATAALLTTFDQQLQPGQKPLLPVP
jgi:4-carboxymuconolactone decarboxylase